MTAILAAREREQRLAAENLRIKNALDKCTTNVMIANAANEIVYMNDSVTQMMMRNESELRKVLPQFDSRRLLNASIDIFHKNPRHQQSMLASLRGNHQTEIQVGGLTFGLVANPIVDDAGQRCGHGGGVEGPHPGSRRGAGGGGHRGRCSGRRLHPALFAGGQERLLQAAGRRP